MRHMLLAKRVNAPPPSTPPAIIACLALVCTLNMAPTTVPSLILHAKPDTETRWRNPIGGYVPLF